MTVADDFVVNLESFIYLFITPNIICRPYFFTLCEILIVNYKNSALNEILIVSLKVFALSEILIVKIVFTPS